MPRGVEGREREEEEKGRGEEVAGAEEEAKETGEALRGGSCEGRTREARGFDSAD